MRAIFRSIRALNSSDVARKTRFVCRKWVLRAHTWTSSTRPCLLACVFWFAHKVFLPAAYGNYTIDLIFLLFITSLRLMQATLHITVHVQAKLTGSVGGFWLNFAYSKQRITSKLTGPSKLIITEFYCIMCFNRRQNYLYCQILFGSMVNFDQWTLDNTQQDSLWSTTGSLPTLSSIDCNTL